MFPTVTFAEATSDDIIILYESMTSKRGIACIVNLHQLDVAVKYSTRIIGLSKGRIVFDGTPDELTDDKIELIYGTSRENLMIGATANE